MGNNTRSKPRTKGQFVVGFIASVSEISNAFENQIRNILAENGIEDPKPDETYPMDAVVSSINQMAEDVGPKMTHRIGVHQVTIPDWPEGVNTVEDGFKVNNEMYSDAYVNFSEDELGKFRFTKTGDREGRAAVTEEFPYPAAFASGIFEGILEDLTSDDAVTNLTEIEAKSDEKVAYEVLW